MALEAYLKTKHKDTQYSVYVVQFSEFKPYEHVDKYVSVPSSWITSDKSSKGRVLVAYPIENPKRTEDRVRIGENFSSNWNQFWADLVAICVNYNAATLWIVNNYKNKRNEESNNINESQRKSVVSETDHNATKLSEAIKRPVASDPRLKLSVNPQKRSRFDHISELSQRSKSLDDSRATALSYDSNAQSASLQNTTEKTTSNMQTTAKSPSMFCHSSTSSHQKRISVVPDSFLIGDRRTQITFVDSSGVNSNSTTVTNYLKQVPNAQSSRIDGFIEYQTDHHSSGSAQPYTIPIQKTSTSTNSSQVIARPDDPSPDFQSSSNKEYSGDEVRALKGALHRNSIETNTLNSLSLVSQPENSVTNLNIKEILLEILNNLNDHTPQIVPNNTTSVSQNSQASVSNRVSQSVCTDMTNKSSIQNFPKTETQSIDVPIEFTPYSDQEVIGYNNEQSIFLKNVLNKMSTLHDNIVERVENVENLVIACTSNNMRRNKNKRNRKRKISINSSGNNDDDDSSSSTSADEYTKRNNMEFDGEYNESQRKIFILPPEYTENDSKWTLQHQMPRPGVVELRPHSGVFVDAIQLGNCLKEARDSKILAQMLLTAIFTPNALSVCSLTNVNGRTNVRPELDEHARNELLEFVESYRCYKEWDFYNTLAIKHALYCKMNEFRTKHENYEYKIQSNYR